MAWDDTKQAAVDPDNPTADEQFPFSEHNAMVAYLKDKLIGKAIDQTDIANDKILVYKTATNNFVFETQSAVEAINDLTDVVISGVPADNEVLAFDFASLKWINQTAAEAGIAAAAHTHPTSEITDLSDEAATVTDAEFQQVQNIGTTTISADQWGILGGLAATLSAAELNYVDGVTSAIQAQMDLKAATADLASYLPLSAGVGEPLTGNLYLGGYQINDVDDLIAHGAGGIVCASSASVPMIFLAHTTYAFVAQTNAHMNSHRIVSVADPTSAQDVSTKNYDDTHLYGYPILAGGPMTDGHILAYDATNGRFEMEAQSAALGLPVADSNTIVKGSADGTKLLRFEVDGFTSGTIRVATFPDKNFTVCGTDEVMLLSGVNQMAGDMDMAGHQIDGIDEIQAQGSPGIQVNDYSGILYAKLADAAHGTNRFYQTVDMSDKRITFLGDPTGGQDAVTKTYGAKHIGGAAATELTISGGEVTATQSYHTIDTEADAATDDLDGIFGGTAGQILTLNAANGGRTVVCKDGAGLALAGDMSLDNENDTLTLQFTGSTWVELSRSNNGA